MTTLILTLVAAFAINTADCTQLTVDGPGVFFVQVGDGADAVRLDAGETRVFTSTGESDEAYWAVWAATDNDYEGIANELSVDAGELLAEGQFCEAQSVPSIPTFKPSTSSVEPEPLEPSLRPSRPAGIRLI